MKGFKIENGVLIDYIEEEGVKEVTIPDSVTSIERGAFSSCIGLTNITIPDSVTSIGGDAFLGCANLTSITIPNGVTRIELETFRNCISLTSVTIPDSVTSIGCGAFSSCIGLTNITIPDSVTSIERGAFLGCTGLESITIPDNVTWIRDDTFHGCTNLESITIPDSVTSIGEGAFFRSINLKTKKANYKAFGFQTGRLKCRKYEYKENEWSENIDDIAICEWGYHFCDNLFAVFNYYSGEIDKDIAIYECEVGEKVETDGIKSVTNRIKPVKRLYREDVIRILNGGE